MTVNDVTTHVLGLLGYARTTPRTEPRALAVFNLVYTDLARLTGRVFTPAVYLTDAVELRDDALDTLIAGVAAYTAFSEGDTMQGEIYAKVYDKLRSKLAIVDTLTDVLPRGGM